ncbi:Protein fmp32, mitochondrial [Entomophthora muscae]|uniref:Protein fmp32, mitochondrial n=1 Tax=Entomophthora muscae TaxID=34485 RepID=A0ACC2RKT3_9FUNG|nr:Protein fmp32, mitochondrial [Entomophthora muscae]
MSRRLLYSFASRSLSRADLFSVPRANFSTSLMTRDSHSPYLFDTHEFVTKLESEGFTRQQSETIVTCLHDVMSESFNNLASGLVTKEQQEKSVYTYKVDFAQLKSEIQMLEKNDFAVMKSENEKLAGEVEKLKRRLKDEICRTQAGVRLDMNLEKGRLRNEASQQTSKLNDSQAKIEQEIYNLRAQMENIKFQILQYMVGTITGTSALILAYLRMFR